LESVILKNIEMKELLLSELKNVNGGGWSEGYEMGYSEAGENLGRAFVAAVTIISAFYFFKTLVI